MTYAVSSDVFPAVLVVMPPDTFPASIYGSAEERSDAGGTLRERVRVISLTSPERRLLAWVDSAQGPELFFNEPYTLFTEAPAKAVRFSAANRSTTPEYTATLPDGRSVAWYRLGGCGCGSQLKSFNPFTVLTRIASNRDAQPAAADA